jgi:hypothetical protein
MEVEECDEYSVNSLFQRFGLLIRTQACRTKCSFSAIHGRSNSCWPSTPYLPFINILGTSKAQQILTPFKPVGMAQVNSFRPIFKISGETVTEAQFDMESSWQSSSDR